MNEPIPLRSNHMSVAEYERERAELRELYGDSSSEAAAKRDQALALLFYRSGWTQEELAKKEGKSRKWVDQHVRFGRFLNFGTTGTNSEFLPKNFTERRFRSFWERTDKDERNERVRFDQVIKLLQEADLAAPRRPQIGEDLKAHYADGKWHPVDAMATKLQTHPSHVRVTCEQMQWRNAYDCKAERKKVGTDTYYRIFKMDKTISLAELIEKLTPIVKGLKTEGRKNTVTMSPPMVARLAHQLQQLLDEWAE